MPDSKYKIVKDGWGNRTNFQASYGLRTMPGDLEEGDGILELMQENDASRPHQNIEREPESDWVKGNRERYEAGGRSPLKEAAARQLAEEYNFAQTGDPEMDLIVAMGLRDMKDDPEFSHMFEPQETVGSSSNAGETDRAPEEKRMSKRQMKLARQRESARRFNEQRSSG